MIEQQMQEKYYEMQLHDAEINRFEKQFEDVESQLAEISTIVENLTSFKDLKEGDELLVPIAHGIFCKATLGKTEELNVNVGMGVNVTKNVDGTIALLYTHRDEITQFKQKLLARYEKLLAKREQLEEEALALAEQYERNRDV